MDNYKLSYSRQQALNEETIKLDEQTDKIKKQNDFNKAVKNIKTTKTESLREVDRFISDGTIREFVSANPVRLALTSIAITMLIELLMIGFMSLLVIFVAHQPINQSMVLALFVMLLIPSLLLSFKICDEAFLHTSRLDKLKKKVLSHNYMINDKVIDCPIEIKRVLLDQLEYGGYLYISYSQYNKAFKYFAEDGEEECVNLLEYDSNPLYYTKECSYFKDQLARDKMYRISDILTDRAFKEQ